LNILFSGTEQNSESSRSDHCRWYRLGKFEFGLIGDLLHITQMYIQSAYESTNVMKGIEEYRNRPTDSATFQNGLLSIICPDITCIFDFALLPLATAICEVSSTAVCEVVSFPREVSSTAVCEVASFPREVSSTAVCEVASFPYEDSSTAVCEVASFPCEASLTAVCEVASFPCEASSTAVCEVASSMHRLDAVLALLKMFFGSE
jgi:hypothetical protein